MNIKIGDIVAIQGDKRLRMDGTCQYTPDQLVNGKYVKHSGHGGIWTGKVEAISGDRAKVGGGWWHFDMLAIMARYIKN